ncbi:uncharacterized protein ACA1_100670 [Acanthamoeba castellanii str. Neff]|uniref:Acanthaporin domain-containing protein n=1 Tax=Acanthamoeba castellanii (strain ATCC 30010 / Neff) TaxID=1257118 RepID=L8GJJ0_ACACF|nr:uncharacterized protein ACA1_100670 [Acanthamoeba castellanii str. Neff]ELR13230.1 hypothetical protein ACA1_100670 [Acanthamoeba castellanii str. Neff]
MRAAFAFVFLLACSLFVAAQASNNVAQCIIAKCSAQVTACYEDPACLSAAECGCATKAAGDQAFGALAQCASQCLYSSTTDVFDLIAPVDAPFGKCSWIKKAACAIGIASAVAACGGPEDILCILAALKALEGCATCFCEDHCHGPCQALHLC